MAEVATAARGDHLLKTSSVNSAYNYYVVTITNAMAQAADSIKICDVPAGYVLTHLHTVIAGTLGASCTAQARIGTTAIAAASTAGGADTKVAMTTVVGPSTSEAPFNYLIGGAAVGAATTLTCGFVLSPAQSVTLAAPT